MEDLSERENRLWGSKRGDRENTESVGLMALRIDFKSGLDYSAREFAVEIQTYWVLMMSYPSGKNVTFAYSS